MERTLEVTLGYLLTEG